MSPLHERPPSRTTVRHTEPEDRLQHHKRLPSWSTKAPFVLLTSYCYPRMPRLRTFSARLLVRFLRRLLLFRILQLTKLLLELLLLTKPLHMQCICYATMHSTIKASVG